MSYPNLQVVFTSSLVGAWLSDKLSSNDLQLFSFAAGTGVISNYKGYMNENYPIPPYGLMIAAILSGYLATHPIMGYVKTSIVLGALAYPTYIVYREVEDWSAMIKKNTTLIISIL